MKQHGLLYQGKYKYKYVSYGDGAKAILEQSTIKFTDPLEFNDPFDCYPSYDEEKIIEVHRSLFKNLCVQSGVSPAKRMMKWKEVEAKFRVDEIDSSIQRTLQKQVGICSLTTKACNLLMWAHYAKNHTGLVFEFSNTIPKDMQEQSKYLCAMHVDYMECKPVIDMLDANYVHSFLVKGQDWQYEDEIRCLNLDGAGIYKYLPELLESVILGAKISEKDEKEIKLIISRLNKVRKKPIALYKARLIKDKFKLYIPQHPVYGDMNWT